MCFVMHMYNLVWNCKLSMQALSFINVLEIIILGYIMANDEYLYIRVYYKVFEPPHIPNSKSRHLFGPRTFLYELINYTCIFIMLRDLNTCIIFSFIYQIGI